MINKDYSNKLNKPIHCFLIHRGKWAFPFLLGFALVGDSYASPTENEFVPCKKLAVKILEVCLNNDEKECWVKSKANYESCRIDIMDMHSPEKRELRRKAEEAEIQKRLKDKEQDGHRQSSVKIND